jgi:ABC-type transport system involved in Fe-S cluster assembly fused permease/ATPase subunit
MNLTYLINHTMMPIALYVLNAALIVFIINWILKHAAPKHYELICEIVIATFIISMAFIFITAFTFMFFAWIVFTKGNWGGADTTAQAWTSLAIGAVVATAVIGRWIHHAHKADKAERVIRDRSVETGGAQ